MKLHLPVRLFRSLMALMLSGPASLYASYSVPTSITLPSGYWTAITVDSSNDIQNYSTTNNRNDVAFYLDADALPEGKLLVDSVSSSIMSLASGSRYFTSQSASSLASLTFSNASDKLFKLSSDASIQFSALNSLLIDGGVSRYNGGVIYGNEITLSQNTEVTFRGNKAFDSTSYYEDASSSGGVIYGKVVTLSRNGIVTFHGNSAVVTTREDAIACGGAIYGGSTSSTIDLVENDAVIFSGNMASSTGSHASCGAGGAIYAVENSSINLSGNGSVTFSGNVAIEETTNSTGACAYGGAIYSTGSNLRIQNNDSVLFENNAEKDITFEGYTYRLRSLYVGGSGNVISFSSPEDKSVEFRDSIYIAAGSTMNLNADYTDGAGVVHKQTGDIIFTGAYAETHLNDLLEDAGAGRVATAGEILNSRTSEVYSMTNLYGGRLRVEDGAIYQGYGITAMEGSNATVRVKDATLSHSGYDLIFNAGTTLELAGTNSISGNLLMKEGSWLSFDSSESIGSTSLQGALIQGSLAFVDGVNISLSHNSDWSAQNQILLRMVGSVSGWDETALTIRNGENNTADISWIDGEWLVLNYNAETFQPTIMGEAIFRSSPRAMDDFYYFNRVSFVNINDSSIGGAINGSDVELSNNGDVVFSGNNATDYSQDSFGGAIYGDNITLRNNRTVTYNSNKAESVNSFNCAMGGAIYGSSIELGENEVVTFIGNTAYSNEASMGGAIYGSSIDLRENGDVRFSNNTAEAEYYGGYNRSCRGGAIYGSSIVLSGNDDVVFANNTARVAPYHHSYPASSASANGGAIYAYGNLSIQNNDSVLFEKNAEITEGSYRLRSIYAGGRGAVISLSAADDKSIEFRDSIYISSGSVVKLNADYTDENGVVHKQTGDIIFTGAYTETHLNDLLEDAEAWRVATAGEILNSRTSEVYAMTNLYGGRLRVEDGAIYQGYGITAMEGSNATVRVKDATLSHRGYDLTFHDGTLLEIDGVSTVSGNVNLLSGSFLNILANSTLDMEEYSILHAENGANIALGTDATLNLEGSFVAGDAVVLELSEGAAVSRGVTTICNNGGKDVVQLDAVAFASGTMQKVKDAHVVVDSSEDTSITYQLENASVENRGGGKLTMTHENNSISSVSSAGGDVEILNVDSSDRGNILKLNSLELHESAVFGAYVGDTVSADAEACVQVSGSAVFGVGTTVNADLVLMDGCILTMDDTVHMGSDLSINGTLTLDGDLLSLIQNAEIRMHFDLFTGIDDLYLNGVLFDSIALTDNMSASTYFIGLEDVPESERYYRLSYASETPGEGVLSVHVVSIPEPTTATLGILALAGLAARRRRRW